MTLVRGLDKVYSFEARKRLGYSGGFGLIKFGDSRFGYYNSMAGIYTLKRTRNGKEVSRMVMYRPSNPQTAPQQANRSKFAAAMAAWSSLTSEEKRAYTERAKRRSMFGWSLFIREYYQSLA